MNYVRPFSFMGGFLLGGFVGAAVAVLTAPAPGEETREQIRSEGVALRNRTQEYGNDRIHDAQRMVKQGQKGVSDAIGDTKDNLREAVGAGK